jgi:hypothetical protein
MGQSQSPERRVPSRRYGVAPACSSRSPSLAAALNACPLESSCMDGGDGAAAAVLAMQERCGERSRAGGRSHPARSGRLTRSTRYARSSSRAGVSGSATETIAIGRKEQRDRRPAAACRSTAEDSPWLSTSDNLQARGANGAAAQLELLLGSPGARAAGAGAGWSIHFRSGRHPVFGGRGAAGSDTPGAWFSTLVRP